LKLKTLLAYQNVSNETHVLNVCYL